MTKSLKIRSFGSGSGSDLVLLHGWGMNSGAFEQWIELLTPNYKVTLVDLPGFGINHEVLPETYTLQSVCDLVEPAIPSNAVLLGWSLGGLVAQQLAIQLGAAIKGLVTIGSSPCFVQNENWTGIKKDVLSMFVKQLDISYEKTLERFLAIQAMGSDNARVEARLLKKAITQFPSPASKALHGGLDILAKSDLRCELGRIITPTLRLYGKLDSIVPIAAADAIQQLQLQSQSIVIPSAAHGPFISHPEETAHFVHQFVGGLHRSSTS
ncbi:pimeloyl-ACP methyl ester esterase BioH [Alteromonas sp. 5E99-2]|uniref:pimeloyl-ACP methyl ester esterase BioH n=1 Tax=Alteromonas sp. 5E99-2 TaxID=2817683 RepID=UPI001F603883|nr:pimeloyl-ACP methyl ester esterase BioH [Alteromonas sp. 5E99-2]